MTELINTPITPSEAGPDVGMLGLDDADAVQGIARESRSPMRLAVRRFRRNKLAMIGLGFIIMIVAAQGLPSPEAKLSIMWLVSSTAIYTLGELYLSPIGL